MDVALGVSVTGALARLALVESDAYGDAVLDESMLDLTQDPVATLADTVTGTHRMLADEGHRLAATRLCWSDAELMAQLRRALDEAGVENVFRATAGAVGGGVGAQCGGRGRRNDDAVGARRRCADGRTGSDCGCADDGRPVADIDSAGGAATTAEPAMAGAEPEQQLAYSMTDDDSELLPVEYAESDQDDYGDDEGYDDYDDYDDYAAEYDESGGGDEPEGAAAPGRPGAADRQFGRRDSGGGVRRAGGGRHHRYPPDRRGHPGGASGADAAAAAAAGAG